MKIKETRKTMGAAGTFVQERVRKLAEGETMPPDAVEAAANAKEHDWQAVAPDEPRRGGR